MPYFACAATVTAPPAAPLLPAEVEGGAFCGAADTGATVVPSGLGQASATPQNTPATSSAGNNGAAGGALTVGAQAKYGIPCVY